MSSSQSLEVVVRGSLTQLQVAENMSNFQLLEVVGRGSETQLQVGDNLYMLTSRIEAKV